MVFIQYRQFEQAVLRSVHAYRRIHDPAHLEKAARAIRRLGVDFGELTAPPTDNKFMFRGWVLPLDGIRLRIALLRRLNPGYRIRIRRVERSEIGLRARMLRFGFVIDASGSADLPPFRLRLADRTGSIYELAPSNVEASFKLAAIEGGHRAVGLPASRPRGPIGYIDEIQQSPVPREGRRTSWLLRLVHSHPSEVFDIIDSPHGRFFADAARQIMGMYPANARWADRFTLSAGGAPGAYASDLAVLRVVRAEEPEAPAGATADFLPEPHVSGRLVTWKPGRNPVRRPSGSWLRLGEAVVQDGGTVIVDDKLIVYEASSDPSLDFVSGQWDTVFGSRANRELALVQLRSRAADTLGEAILLSGRNDANWFHWLIEYLPRILLVPIDIATEVPVVVSSRTPSAGLQALAILTERPVIVLDPQVAQGFERLHVLAPPVQVLDTTVVAWRDGLRMNADALRGLRSALDVDKWASAPPRRVFLRRMSAHRSTTNEDVLAGVATRYGLELVDPGTLNFSEQLELFATAELVVGASGAVMANYIMMRPGSTVLAFTSRQLYDFVLPAAIAAVAGVRFTSILGRSSSPLKTYTNRNNWFHGDFHVDPKDFQRALARALAGLS